MTGLKKAIAGLVCSLFVTAGAGVTACYFFDGAHKQAEEVNNIVGVFLDSPELAANVSGEVLASLKQEKNKEAVCSLMKKLSPETYTLYCNANSKTDNFGKAAALTTVAAVIAAGGVTKYAIDTNNERRKRNYKKAQKREDEFRAWIEVQDTEGKERVWERIEKDLGHTEESDNITFSEKVDSYCHRVDAVCDMIYETFGQVPSSAKSDDGMTNTK